MRYALVLIIVLTLVAPAASAETTYISNTTSASSNSGGNVAEGGEVVEGKSKSSVSSKTVINGTVYEYEEEGEEEASIKTVITADGDDVEVKTETIAPALREIIPVDAVLAPQYSPATTTNEATTTVMASTSVAAVVAAENEEEGGFMHFIASVIGGFFSYVGIIF